jgi:hypothetical protein
MRSVPQAWPLTLALCASTTTTPKAAPRQAKTAVIDPDPIARASVDDRGCQLGQGGSDPLGVYRNDPWTKGQVVLTFDDGPHPYATPKVLDLLAKPRLRATFFVVGHAINDKTFRSIKRMVAEGHTIGSHSYNHDIDMGFRDYGERSVEYIRGQHEITRILIDLSLLAESESEFDALFTRVFAKKIMGLPVGACAARRVAGVSRSGIGRCSRRAALPDGAAVPGQVLAAARRRALPRSLWILEAALQRGARERRAAQRDVARRIRRCERDAARRPGIPREQPRVLLAPRRHPVDPRPDPARLAGGRARSHGSGSGGSRSALEHAVRQKFRCGVTSSPCPCWPVTPIRRSDGGPYRFGG